VTVARENNGEHCFLAQASVSRLGEINRGSPRPFARVVAQATNPGFEQGNVSLRRGGLEVSYLNIPM